MALLSANTMQPGRAAATVLVALLVSFPLPLLTQEPLDDGLQEETQKELLARQRDAIGAQAAAEELYYRLLTMPLQEGMSMEVGGLLQLSDGRIMAGTRRGEIFIVENAFSDPPAPVFKQYAFGLGQPLGLLELDGWIYTAQRGELTRIRDTDGDDRADVFETVTDAWETSGDYHEYVFGPPPDAGRQALGDPEHSPSATSPTASLPGAAGRPASIPRPATPSSWPPASARPPASRSAPGARSSTPTTRASGTTPRSSP